MDAPVTVYEVAVFLGRAKCLRRGWTCGATERNTVSRGGWTKRIGTVTVRRRRVRRPGRTVQEPPVAAVCATPGARHGDAEFG